MRTPEQEHHLLELLATIMITVATVATAWCAYQSNIWSGVQEFGLHTASEVNREAAFRRTEANQLSTMDVQLFSNYIEAKILGRDSIASFYIHRMPPRLRTALNEWLTYNPFNDSNAPKHPFLLKSYVLEDRVKADSLDGVYEKIMHEAEESNTHSDDYVLLTVIFASVMFFGGICSNIQQLMTKRWIIIVSALLLISAVVWMSTFPVSFS